MDLYNYYYFSDVFTPKEIKDILEMCESLPKEIVTNEYDSSDDYIRRGEISYLEYEDNTHWIYEKIYEYVIQANVDMGWNFDLDGIEDEIEYSVFYDNSGQYVWHSDMLLENNKNKLVAYLDLSTKDEYEGGELQINLGPTISTVESNIGTLTILPSYLMYRVTPIINGVKRGLIIRASGKSFN